jgi:hypothetical protein
MASELILNAQTRSDPQVAALVMETLCPSAQDRKLVLGQLFASIRVAEKVSSSAWALTLNHSGFRLNVGPVEVLTFAIAKSVKHQYVLLELRLLIHGEISSETQAFLNEDAEIHGLQPSHYKSVAQPQMVYIGLGDIGEGELTEANRQKLVNALRLLQTNHAQFISNAAVTSTGKVRRASSFHLSHSDGLYRYATTFLANEISAYEKPKTTELNTPLHPPEGELNPRELQSIATKTYARNDAVKSWVLARAKGSCESCAEPAPFVSESGEPYLEVHHIKQLAHGGSDRVSNTVALCPNCHRQFHFGKYKEALRDKVLSTITELQSE